MPAEKQARKRVKTVVKSKAAKRGTARRKVKKLAKDTKKKRPGTDALSAALAAAEQSDASLRKQAAAAAIDPALAAMIQAMPSWEEIPLEASLSEEWA